MNSPESSDKEQLKLQIRRRTLQSRMLMLFAIGSTVVLVFCCVPLMVFQVLFGLEISEDATKVEAVARKIAPFIVPPNFAPSRSYSADNSFMQAQIVRFNHAQGRGRFVVGQLQLKVKLPGITPEQDAKLLQTFVDELVQRMRTLDTEKSRTKLVTIHGQEVSFTIAEGEDPSSTTRLRQATGAFIGPKGAFQLILQAETDFITDDSIDALLDSLADVTPPPST